jgi:hypothetical protein
MLEALRRSCLLVSVHQLVRFQCNQRILLQERPKK